MSWLRVALGAGKVAHKAIKAYKKSKKIKPIVDKKIKPIVKDYAKETKGLVDDTREIGATLLSKSQIASVAVAVPTILAVHGAKKIGKKIVKTKLAKTVKKKSKSLTAKLKNIWKQSGDS